MSTTAVSVIPEGLELPAHLRTPEAARMIAEANAAAAGGLKAGGFPRISIKNNMFHLIDSGDTTTLMQASQTPGAPPTPMQCLVIALVGSNAGICRTYYKDEYVQGSNKEPDCRSTNGVVPDTGVPLPQNNACATCEQMKWGSAVSKLTGKDIPACSESKQLAVVPMEDLGFKALGFSIGPGSIGNWKAFVDGMTARNIPVMGVAINVTFELGKTGVVQFTFNRFLSVEETAKVIARGQGDDVRLITSPSRTVAVPQLAAPVTALPANVIPIQPVAALPAAASVAPEPPPAAAPVATGFAAVASAPVQAPAAATPAPAAPVTRTRKPRTQAAAPAAAAIDLSYLDPALKAFVESQGVDSVAGKTVLAANPPPVVADTRLDHLPPAVKTMVIEQGGADSPTGVAILASMPPPTGAVAATAVAQPVQPAAVAAALVASTPAPVAAPAATGFAAVGTPAVAVTPVVSAATMSLIDTLKAKLSVPAAA